MFARFSVKRPHMVMVAIILVIITGVLSFRDIGIDFLPNIELPYIVVATVYPGGESEEAVEERVTVPMEQNLATAGNIKTITTESYPMISFIILEFKSGTDINASLIEINEKVKNFKTIQESQGLLDSAASAGGAANEIVDRYAGAAELVNRVLDPVVMTISPNMLPIMKIALYEEGKSISESSETLKAIAKKIETVDGVASADVTGLVEKMYLLNVDNGKIIRAVLSSFIDREKAFSAFYDGLLSILDYAESGRISEDLPKVRDAVENIIDKTAEVMTGLVESAINDTLSEEADKLIFDSLKSFAEDVLADFYTGDAVFDAFLDGISEGVIGVLDEAKAAVVEIMSDIAGDTNAGEIESEREKAIEKLNEVYEDAMAAAEDVSKAISAPSGLLADILRKEEVRSQYKILFGDAIDAFYDYAGVQIGEIAGAELLETAIFANDIEMPVGSPNGAIITVGDGIKTEEELFALPIAYINVADEVLNAVTGLRLKQLDQTQKMNAVLLTFADALLKIADDPAGAIKEIAAAIEGTGLQLDTLFSLLGIADIGSDLGGLIEIGGIFSENGLSLGGLIAANDAFGEAVSLASDGGILLTLDDLCVIAEVDNQSRLHTVLNGVSGMQININKSPSASTADVSRDVKSMLDGLTAQNPGLRYVVLEDHGGYIRLVVDTIMSSLIVGGILAVLILLFFLKKIGPTIVVGSSIVLSLILAFIMMRIAGVDLNIASMGGLVLGVGMLVDNSIVVIENIFSQKSEGKGIFEAAIDGANQVTEAIIASTITTVIVFVPLFFTSGIASDIFKDLALTMSFSIAASLIVAMTFVPMAATTFIKNVDKVSRIQERAFALFDKFAAAVKKRPKFIGVIASPVVLLGNLFIKETSERDGKAFNMVKRAYKSALSFCLNKKAVPLITAGVLLGLAVGAAFAMNTKVIPELDMNTVNMHFDVDEHRINELGIEENDVLETLMYASEDVISSYSATDVTDAGISVYTGFKIMGSSIEDMSGGLVNTDGLFSGTLFGGAMKGGDLECTILLKDKKERKKSAAALASEISAAVLGGKHQKKTESGAVVSEHKLSDFVAASWSFNSIAEIASLDSDSVQINVYAEDREILERETQKLTDMLRNGGVKGVVSVGNTLEERAFEYRLVLDKEAVSKKTGGFNATVILELLKRFTEPSPGTSVTLTDADGSRYTYDLTVYPAGREVLKWYRIDPDMLPDRDAGVYDKIYIEKGLEGGAVAERYYTYDNMGIKWHLERRTDANGREIFANVEQTTGKVRFSLYKKSETVYYSAEFRDAINSPYDLLYHKLPYENPLTGETGTVALHELLAEECLIRDADGNPADIVKVLAAGKVGKNGGARYLPITVYFSEDAGVNQVKSAVNKAVSAYYKENGTPAGVSYSFSSSTALVDDIFNTLYFILGIGVILIYLVMVAQFRSLKDPLIIMFTVLLAFTGSALALFISGMEISMLSIIAFIVLAGVVVNNGIVFIDYVNRELAKGACVREAILNAAGNRLRPILMTALTTIVSLLVMAFDTTQAASILRPMGVAAVGGLIYATVLTLIIVPVMFELLNKEKKNGKKRFRLFADNYEYFNKEKIEKKLI
ncbi:MAG: efflux RND transporter permease subunit [Clostridiales bacterium]|jgi:multidrug efflux pump subunit AcrB|nr:efflux RND transporter permease subunit [Clostridiales bacterium]